MFHSRERAGMLLEEARPLNIGERLDTRSGRVWGKENEQIIQ